VAHPALAEPLARARQLAAPALVAALGVLWVHHNTPGLRCDRAAKQCVARVGSWPAVASRAVELAPDALQGAYVEVHTKVGATTTYRVVLRTAQGNVPLTDFRSGVREAKDAVAADVNAFAHNPALPRLSTTQDENRPYDTFIVLGILFVSWPRRRPGAAPATSPPAAGPAPPPAGTPPAAAVVEGEPGPPDETGAAAPQPPAA
jgi:hypothetical protein